jgi:hypothetical protein
VPLALLLALNEPQVAAELPGVQLQVTPPLPESLVTVAVIESFPPVDREAGAVLNETDGVVLPPPPPPPEFLELPLQPTRAAIMLKLIRRGIDLRNVIVRDVIAHLR